ncbi:MAG: ribosome silencing factor [Thermodesulfobacteriota bacterium]
MDISKRPLSMTADLSAVLTPFISALLSRKALNVVILDVHNLTSVADAFIICSGRSNRQVTAIAEHLHEDLKKQGFIPLSFEGKKEGHWVLLDYGQVIIHIFYEPMRRLYDLEGLWVDAKKIENPMGDS